MSRLDVIVIGAGIAGASVAAHLAQTQNAILIEREERPGYHATGRSAAFFTEIYGNPLIRALTRASRQFLFDPPPGFAEGPLTRPRGCLYIAAASQLNILREFATQPDIACATRDVSLPEALRLCPMLRAELPRRGAARARRGRYRRARPASGIPASVPPATRANPAKCAGAGHPRVEVSVARRGRQ